MTHNNPEEFANLLASDLRFLDPDRRAFHLDDVIPEFSRDALSEASQALREDQSAYKMAQSRFRAFSSSAGYPVTPHLPYEREVFEESMFKVLGRTFDANDPLSPSLEELEKRICVPLVLDLTLLAAHNLARSVRPTSPLPTERPDGTSVVDAALIEIDGISWMQIAFWEIELITREEYSSEVDATSLWVAGLWSVGEHYDFRNASPMSNGSSSIALPLKPLKMRYRTCPLVVKRSLCLGYGDDYLLEVHRDLWRTLGLRAGEHNALSCFDETGNEGVKFRRWQMQPSSREYDREAYRLVGADLLLRLDLFEKLHRECEVELLMVCRRIDTHRHSEQKVA